MFLFTWSSLKKDNKRIKRFLGVEKGKRTNLTIKSGFFVAPDDVQNRECKKPHILLDFSVLQMFEKRYSKLFETIEYFFNIAGGFNRLDYEKFKKGAKLTYFFAAAYHVYSGGGKDISKISSLYSNKKRKIIDKNLGGYLIDFIRLAEGNGVKMNVISLFRYAVKLIKENRPDLYLENEFNSLSSFMGAPREGFYPFTGLIGSTFEDECNFLFKNVMSKDFESLTRNIVTYLGKDGILFPLDEDKEFKNFTSQYCKGIKVPDYLFITKDAIYPFDLKINLGFTKYVQISEQNLRKLFSVAYPMMSKIFDGISVEGKYVEYVKVEKREKKIEKVLDTPMQVMKKEGGFAGKDIGIVAQLWNEGKPISQDALVAVGCKHSNLAHIVKIFNDMLAMKGKTPAKPRQKLKLDL